jgi:hypothetical protein
VAKEGTSRWGALVGLRVITMGRRAELIVIIFTCSLPTKPVVLQLLPLLLLILLSVQLNPYFSASNPID